MPQGGSLLHHLPLIRICSSLSDSHLVTCVLAGGGGPRARSIVLRCRAMAACCPFKHMLCKACA